MARNDVVVRRAARGASAARTARRAARGSWSRRVEREQIRQVQRPAMAVHVRASRARSAGAEKRLHARRARPPPSPAARPRRGRGGAAPSGWSASRSSDSSSSIVEVPVAGDAEGAAARPRGSRGTDRRRAWRSRSSSSTKAARWARSAAPRPGGAAPRHLHHGEDGRRRRRAAGAPCASRTARLRLGCAGAGTGGPGRPPAASAPGRPSCVKCSRRSAFCSAVSCAGREDVRCPPARQPRQRSPRCQLRYCSPTSACDALADGGQLLARQHAVGARRRPRRWPRSCFRPATRTMKNSSRFDADDATELEPLAQRHAGSRASSSTRSLNSSQDSSRLRNSPSDDRSSCPCVPRFRLPARRRGRRGALRTGRHVSNASYR